MKKLNIGCGQDYREGYVNIDVRKEVKPDIVLDVENEKLPFLGGEVDEIIAYDVLEHINFRKVEDVLREFNRVMVMEGVLRIRVPDMKKLAERILERRWNYREISYWIYGAQDYPENVHRTGFTFETLTGLLQHTGFVVICHWNDNSNLLVVAEKFKNLK